MTVTTVEGQSTRKRSAEGVSHTRLARLGGEGGAVIAEASESWKLGTRTSFGRGRGDFAEAGSKLVRVPNLW